jgi:hypothetical protein
MDAPAELQRTWTIYKLTYRDGNHQCGHTLESGFSGTFREARVRAIGVAKANHTSVTLWTPLYGPSGSVVVNPWDLP